MEKFWHNGEWATVIGPGYEVGRTGANNRYMVWGGIANPDLKWESTSQLDFGVDFAAFDRRLRLTADVYYKKTTDLLREKYLPLSSSYDKIWVNDGEVTNKGFEVSLEGDIVHTRDWSFSATFIYSMNRNKVVSLGDAISSGLSQDYLTGMYYEVTGEPISMFNQNASIYAVGHPMNVFYGYRVDGIIQEGQDPGFIDPDGLKDRPGELKYVDLTGDYAITPEDRCIIGDPNPDFTASLNLSLRWKNLDLSVFLYGVYGKVQTLYNLPAAFVTPMTISIVPAIAAMVVQKKYDQGHAVAESALRISAAVAMPMGIGLAVLSDPIVNVLYPRSNAAGPTLLFLLGIASVFVCISLITTAVLQATGHELCPVWSMLAGGVAKVAVNWFLIAVPEVNITGAPIGTLACYVVICIVNYIFLCRTLHERLHIGCCLARPLLSTLTMAVVAWGVYTGLAAVMGGDLSWKRTALAMLVSMVCAVVTYLIAVVKTRAITLADLQLIPKGEKVAKVLHIR